MEKYTREQIKETIESARSNAPQAKGGFALLAIAMMMYNDRMRQEQ